MDVLALIKEEHDKIRSRLREVLEAKGIKNRRTAILACEGSLRVHLELEKDYLYPEITDLYPGSDHVIQLGLTAGVAIKRKLAQLVKMAEQPQAKQTGFEGKWDKLVESVEKHFATQEEMLMPRMRAAIRTEDREDLGQLFREVREDLAAAVAGGDAAPVRARRRA